MNAVVDQCSVCKTGITPQQYTQTKKLFGDHYCADCIPDQIKKGDAAINAAEPADIRILKELGWTFDKGAFMKEIDGKSVLIVYSDIAKKGGACMIAGKPFMPEDNPIVTKELKALFDKIDGKTEKPKPAPVKTTPKAIAAPQSETGGLGNSLATIQDITLSPENIISLVCPKASMNEAVLFLQVCKLRQLNPFIPGEVFLIKMDESEPAVTVVGKYAFLKKADSHPDYQGYTAGIIVMDTEGKMVEREGTFYMPKGKNWKEGEVFETLVGGWARIKRKGREDFVEKVALQEAVKLRRDGTPNRGWRDQPATMARKVAVVRGHREAFPAELGGLYDKSEIGEE